jgi:hypothetical protein
MKTLLVFFAALITYSANAQTPNFKHDIGIRLSSDQNESFQLQYRFHKNELWSFFAEGTYGGRSSNTQNSQFIFPDSLYEAVFSDSRRSSFGLNLGAQRRLSFMKHDFYYTGASLGFYTSEYRSQYDRVLYLANEGQDPENPFPDIIDVLETETINTSYNSVGVKAKLFVGADFPLTDRLNLNFELGMNADYDIPTTQNFRTMNMNMYFLGGLRYQFGKTE